MQHKQFRICSIAILILVCFSVGFFDYITISNKYDEIKLLVKTFPLVFLLFLNAFYFFIYRATIYSIFTFSSLFFCLIGDLFLGLYTPLENNDKIYLIVGGSVFLLARLNWIFIFLVKPYKNIIRIRYNNCELFTSHIIWTFTFIAISIPLLYKNIKIITILSFLYIILGFGLPVSYAFLRLINRKEISISDNDIAHESLFSLWTAFLGILLFNISDILLLYTLQTELFPNYVVLISDHIYWLSMYLLTISIVRCKYTLIEKRDYF